MTDPTPKQIAYGQKLGIDTEGHTKESLSKLIDAKLNKTPAQTPQAQPTEVSRHDLVISRVEKPHSFELGKAGERHKVYYKDVPELKGQIKELEEAGLYFPSGAEFEVPKGEP